MVKMIIDATNMILGRMASYAAKKAMLGESVDIINCEKAVITGKRSYIIQRYQKKAEIGTPATGPFYPKQPHMLVKRTIRGMLAYRKEKGAKAYKRLKCYPGVPDKFKDKKLETVPGANISNVPSLKYVVIKDVCRMIGGKE